MALSRTARVLIAVLLLAAAGFFWVNYFQQNQLEEAPLAAAPTPATPPAQPSGLSVPAGDAATGDAAAPAGAPPTGEPPAGEPAQPAPGEAGETPVVVGEPPPVVVRRLVVSELPFLVTEPEASVDAESPEETTAAVRALPGTRASVNPFSPILVTEPPQTEVADTPVEAAPPPTDQIVESSPPPAGTGAAPAARAPEPAPAPTPRALAPPARTPSLPRQLAGGTLTSVPEILREARTAPKAPAGPEDFRGVAATLLPKDVRGGSVNLPQVSEGVELSAAAPPEPLGTARTEQVRSGNGNGSAPPLAAGADPLSRYLRDNNVRFTGQVLGPLGVGVFRSNMYQQPVVVTLGQTLPETDILLSDLRGYEARFSLGDNTQALSLDSRR